MPVSDVLRIDGVYYDTQKMADAHPGGDLVVLMCNKQDATAMFNSSHRRTFNHEKYKKFVVNESDVAEASKLPVYTQKYDTYFEICEKVKPMLAKTGGFATWEYFLKVIFLLGVVLTIDVYTIFYGRMMWMTIVQSFFFGWIGLNIQHDANHGAVSKTWSVNRMLGLSQDVIGGNSLGWMINHNTVHHVHCNDTDLDHDLDIPLLRLHKKVPWKLNHTMQQIYFMILQVLFGPVHVTYNFLLIWSGPTEAQKIYKHYWSLNQITSLILPLRIVSIAMHSHSIQNTLLHMFVQYAVGGLYLAFFFIISHNFEGVHKENIDSTQGCFVRNQVETSCNVGGAKLAQINGGLNFQIEHHLFPRVHHSNYAKIAPAVKEICKKKGISYVHYPTIWENFYSTYTHLKNLGKKPLA